MSLTNKRIDSIIYLPTIKNMLNVTMISKKCLLNDHLDYYLINYLFKEIKNYLMDFQLEHLQQPILFP